MRGDGPTGGDRWRTSARCDAPWRRREERMGEEVAAGELDGRLLEERAEREEVDFSLIPIAVIDGDCRRECPED